jgi:hypothetical protein
MKSPATDPAALGKRLDWLLTAVYDGHQRPDGT